MVAYHTNITINAPKELVWKWLTDFESYQQWNPLVSAVVGETIQGGIIETTIVPLNETFQVKLISLKPQQEIVWQGKRGAKFLLAGKHYYRLKAHDLNTTILEHGEYFTGILSPFIPKRLLRKMEETFVQHNQALKDRIENAK